MNTYEVTCATPQQGQWKFDIDCDGLSVLDGLVYFVSGTAGNAPVVNAYVSEAVFVSAILQ